MIDTDPVVLELPRQLGLASRRTPSVLTGGYALLGLQFVAMVVFSTIQYQRFSLSNDFAGYAQAWRDIAAGHLNPYVSVFRIDFLHNNMDLAMYPLALLEPLVRTPVMLSYAEDLVVALAGAVALGWSAEIVMRHGVSDRWRTLLLSLTAVGLALNPWSLETAAFPFHFEPFAALFALVAARELWRGRLRRLFVWVPLAMAAEALGSLYVLAIGLAALCERGRRRIGAALCAIGLGGLAIVVRLGLVGRGQATLVDSYGYLGSGRHAHLELTSLLLGVVTHLGPTWHVLSGHLAYCAGYLLAAGVLGIASPIGAAAFLCIVAPDALASHVEFIDFTGAFQNWPAEPLLTVGTVGLFARLVPSSPWAKGAGDRTRLLVALVASVSVLGAALIATTVPDIPSAWIMPAPTAAWVEKAYARLPKGAEVIGDQDILGRFAEGDAAFSFYRTGQAFPIERGVVVVVFAPGYHHNELAIAARLRRMVGATTLVHGGGIEALVWRASHSGTLTFSA